MGAAAFVAGCGERSRPSPGQPRVVSLSPSTTEAVFAIGAGAYLVGRSRFCDHPPEVEKIPSVGGFSDPSIEAVLALSPTLVVGAQGPAGPGLAEQLGARRIDTYFPRTESFDEICAMIEGLGARLGRADEAGKVTGRIRRNRRSIQDTVKDLPVPRAVMVFDTGPIVVAGPGSFPDELMRLAGARNVITEGGPYPTIGLERLVALDPDVLLDGSGAGMGGSSVLVAKRDTPGWRSLRSFERGRVYAVGSKGLRPGPRIDDGLADLARAIHAADFGRR